MTDDIMPKISTENPSSKEAAGQPAELRIRLGPNARRLVETSKNLSASSVARLEIAIEEIEAQNAELARQLAQASSNTPPTSTPDLSFLPEEFIRLNRAVQGIYEEVEKKQIENRDLFSDISAQLQLVRTLVTIVSVGSNDQRIALVKELEQQIEEFQNNLAERTGLNTEKYQKYIRGIKEGRDRYEQGMRETWARAEEHHHNQARPGKEAERG